MTRGPPCHGDVALRPASSAPQSEFAEAAGSVPVEAAGVGPEVDFAEAVGKGVGAAVLIAGGFAVGGLGGVLLLIGFIWLIVSLASKPPLCVPPPGSYGPPPGGWGPR